jgi:hypothetical protein
MRATMGSLEVCRGKIYRFRQRRDRLPPLDRRVQEGQDHGAAVKICASAADSASPSRQERFVELLGLFQISHLE